MQPSKWSDDAFLDSLRLLGDPAAEACVDALASPTGATGTTEGSARHSDFAPAFAALQTNGSPIPPGLPAPLARFLEQSRRPRRQGDADFDRARIGRGASVFYDHAIGSALALLCKSLPEGYAAPNLSIILNLTGNLRSHPYKRLLGVLQLLVDISTDDALEPSGRLIVGAQKMRLLHAGIRHIVRSKLPHFEAAHQTPVNLEDMLGTVMGFSLLVIEGLEVLGHRLQPEEQEDYYYLWRVFAQWVGIHPVGAPDSADFIPANVAEAREFYASYARRHYVGADCNPDGVLLAQSNLELVARLIHETPFRFLGSKALAAACMEELMGRDGCARLGLGPVTGRPVTRWLLKFAPRAWLRLGDAVDELGWLARIHRRVSRSLFQGLIEAGFRGGRVTFLIPQDVRDLAGLIKPKSPKA